MTFCNQTRPQGLHSVICSYRLMANTSMYIDKVIIRVRLQNTHRVKPSFLLENYCKWITFKIWDSRAMNFLVSTIGWNWMIVEIWWKKAHTIRIILSMVPLQLGEMECWMRNLRSSVSSCCTILKVHVNKLIDSSSEFLHHYLFSWNLYFFSWYHLKQSRLPIYGIWWPADNVLSMV